MPRAALTLTTLSTAGTATARPAGTAGATDGHSINCPGEELFLDITIATATTTVTVLAGDNPPALAAGQGNLASSLAVGSHFVGPFESGRYVQSDGTIHVDYGTPANVTIRPIRLPRV